MKNSLFLICLLAVPILQADGPSAFAIRDARIVRVSSPAIERGTLLIRDGLIEGVGENLSIPADAWVIDGNGLTVYPGLIDALSTWGIPEPAPAGPGTQRPAAPVQGPPGPPPPVPRGPEDRPSNSSWVRAADLLDVADKRIELSRNLPYQAAAAVAFGLRHEEALKAMTLYPAQIWGAGDQIGSIEEGKWADLMITDGDPLEPQTQVKELFIKGKPVTLDNKHNRLYQKYLNRP
jgi:adenine deaminase